MQLNRQREEFLVAGNDWYRSKRAYQMLASTATVLEDADARFFEVVLQLQHQSAVLSKIPARACR